MMTVNQTILQSLEGLADNKSVFNTAADLRKAGLNVEGPDLCYVRHRAGELRERLNSAAVTQDSASPAGQQDEDDNPPEQSSEVEGFGLEAGEASEVPEVVSEQPGSDAL